jgi:hypothetical protein
MDQATTNEIIKRLDAVAAKVGQGMDHFWPLMVRQEVIEGVVALVVWAVIALALAVAGRIAAKRGVTDKDGDVSPIVVLLVVLVFAFILLTGVAIDASIDMLNPEYAALMNLLEVAK